MEKLKNIGVLWDLLYQKQNKNKKYIWASQPDEFIIKFIPLFLKKRFKSILDLGCGDGRNLIPFLKKKFYAVGIDASREALMLARKKFLKRKYKKFSLILMRLEDLKLPRKFDVIISTKTFKHIFETEKIIKKLTKYLKKGGMINLEFGSLNDSSYLKCKKYGKKIGKYKFLFKKIPYHFYTKKELKKLFSKNFSNLKIKKIKYWDLAHQELSISSHKHQHQSWIVIGEKK